MTQTNIDPTSPASTGLENQQSERIRLFEPATRCLTPSVKLYVMENAPVTVRVNKSGIAKL